MDVKEKYVMQKVNRKEKSICPNCIHHNLCIAENNQPCFECNRFIDANGVTVQKWIPVAERLPETTCRNLVTKYGIPFLAYYTGKEWRESGTLSVVDGITHWMPLPEPSKD